MGDGYDRLSDGNNNGGGSFNGGASFVMGVLTGAVVGAGLALLFAPKAGAALRNQLSDQAAGLAKTATDTAQDGYRRAAETANEWADRGKDAFSKARDVVAKSSEDGKEMFGKAREAVAKGADEVAAAVRRS